MKKIIYIMLCIAFFGVSNYQIKANDDVDSIFYKKGNYFRTREAAEKVAEQIKEIFKNSKAE